MANWCSFNDLRFVRRKEYLGTDENLKELYVERLILQQLWKDIDWDLRNGDCPQEWRDVPVMEVGDE